MHQLISTIAVTNARKQSWGISHFTMLYFHNERGCGLIVPMVYGAQVVRRRRSVGGGISQGRPGVL